MNIFVLDNDPVVAAQMVCDKHVGKMIVESAQMLSTVHRMLDGTPERRRSKSGKTMQQYYSFGDERDNLYYLAVHKFHPCTTWTADSLTNYKWHYEHFRGLAEEFEYRRKKQHVTWQKLGDMLSTPPKNISDKGLTPFAQAMSHYPECRNENAVQAYRNYYHAAKPFAKWNWGRPAPSWWRGFEGYDGEHPEWFLKEKALMNV